MKWLNDNDRLDDITRIRWRFKDWGYIIKDCTPGDYYLKFPVTPSTGANKTWEVSVTPEDVKIKCNTLEVLHFIFNNTFIDDDNCTKEDSDFSKVL